MTGFAEDRDADVVDVDLQSALDEEPCRVLAAPPPTKARPYKPGLRQQPAACVRVVDGDGGSWWMRPDADFGKEAERMRAQPTKLAIPGELNIIGWKAAVGRSG